MIKYIDLEKATDVLDENSKRIKQISTGLKIASFILASGEVDVEDVAPVRHGHWFDHEYAWKCSVCGAEWTFTDNSRPCDNNAKYCPECGSKMDEEVQ